ncbi:UNVERIFIED_CONTAM: hypothetical protein HDU68_012199 [Siphonaria sp. JEL0065]|nr:hypothetical protein HDU68_012199 [Siphonaria sp. JEL0065]
MLKYVKICYGYVSTLEEWFATTDSVDEDGNITDIDERRSYAKLCSSIITISPLSGSKYELDSRLWKTCFYPCIESIRSLIQSSASVSGFAKSSWTSLIGIAVSTFAQILSSTHRNKISSSDTKQSPSMPLYSKYVAYIGDLARYRVILDVPVESFQNLDVSTNVLKGWIRAKPMYTLAAFLAPSNGQHYNHLAIFDLNASQTLSSLTYFIRALNVKVPFPTAHDSIVSLCLGNRTIYNESLKASTRPKQRSGKSTSQQPATNTSTSESIESIMVRAFEIVYTRINRDSLSPILDKLATTLSTQDEEPSSTPPIPPSFFQNSVLLMISLLSVADKLDESGFVSQIRLATFEVLSVLWKGIVARISLDDDHENTSSVDALIAFRLLIGWLSSANAAACFESVESVNALELEWGQLAALARNYNITARESESVSRLLLEEDWVYRGFVPLKDLFPRKLFDAYIKSSSGSLLDLYPALGSLGNNKDRIKAVKNELWVTLSKLPFYELDERHGTFKFKKPRTSVSNSDKLQTLDHQDTDDETSGTVDGATAFDTVLQLGDDEADSSTDFQDLQNRKTQLSSISIQKPSKSTTDSTSSSSENRSFAKLPSKLVLENTTLLFDTNCYIRSISTILKVIKKGWHVLLPLVVVTELDGLSYGGHNDAKGALEAIEPLIKTREEKPSNLSLITYKGSKLPYLMIRTEDWGADEDREEGAGINEERLRGIDDVLLKCAKEWGTKEASKKGVVILVTGDVNLRLKARGAGVFTGSLEDLKGWIGVSISKPGK